jgi:hypothetical protein
MRGRKLVQGGNGWKYSAFVQVSVSRSVQLRTTSHLQHRLASGTCLWEQAALGNIRASELLL